MVNGPSNGSASRNKPLAGLERDAALIRIGRTRRALFVGAAALSAGLAAVVSAVAPGRSLGVKPTFRPAATVTTTASVTGAPSARSHAVRMPPLANPSELGLQAPDAAPQPALSQTAGASPNQSGGSNGSNSSQPAAPAPVQQQAAPAASQAAPAPSPAPAASAPSSGGGVVSGGS